jgi:Gamma-glutamyl cyclotransferase, AIG2-like
MAPVRYAAYGSNLHPLRLRERTPSAALLGTDVLAGYTIAFVKRGKDRSGKCTIIETAGSLVHVAVFEIEEAERTRLDRAEGRGAGYEIRTIELPRFGPCETYVGQPPYLDETLKPYTWYKELVLVGCQIHRFPDTYIERIASVEDVPDPCAPRHDRNLDLLQRARRGA